MKKVDSGSVSSPGYWAFLICFTLLVVGPLCGLACVYLNFKFGNYINSGILGSIIGSVVILRWGPAAKHGANFMQASASTVGEMAAMGVILQAMYWMNMPIPAAWVLVTLFILTGLFGNGVGMMLTPLLVDRWKLKFPTGTALAGILNALSDSRLLFKALARLGGGLAIGGLSVGQRAIIAPPTSWGFSAAIVGAGMIAGPRVALSGLMVAMIGALSTPFLVSVGWLADGQPFRAIGFLIGLAAIFGAALVNLVPVVVTAAQRMRREGAGRMLDLDPFVTVWTITLGVALAVFGSTVLQVSPLFLGASLVLAVVCILINGIATGSSDLNPVSATFMLTVLVLVVVGLGDALTGLYCASIVFVSAAVGVDMQQDRKTGTLLGSPMRTLFLFEGLGVVLGAFMAVYTTKFFFEAYPALLTPGGTEEWQSVMTMKLVGALQSIESYSPQQVHALLLGLSLGIFIEMLRQLLKKPRGDGSRSFSENKALDFIIDVVALPSPFAGAFGSFLTLMTAVWFAVGGVVAGVWEFCVARKQGDDGTPDEMGTPALIAAGLIAGAAIGTTIDGALILLLR